MSEEIKKTNELTDEEAGQAVGGKFFKKCPNDLYESNFYKKDCKGCGHLSYTGKTDRDNVTVEKVYQVNCAHFGKTTYTPTAP